MGSSSKLKKYFEVDPSDPSNFTQEERRNIMLFIAGIMCFKFAFESLNGSLSLFILSRFPEDSSITILAYAQITYGISQSIGSALVGQVVKYFRPSKVISVFIVLFGFFVGIYILAEAVSGGTLTKEGTWNPKLIFAFEVVLGLCLGVMELIRRVIPASIVGNNEDKLKKMDATVHIFYEVSGVSGAFLSTPLLAYLGEVYATILIPPFFFVGGIFYSFVRTELPFEERELSEPGFERHQNYCFRALKIFGDYFMNIGYGAKIVLTSRKYCWLVFGYIIPLVLHRNIENMLIPVFTKEALGVGAYQGILLGGSNFGELLGALFVLRFVRLIPTPLPWVRLDALSLSLLWVLPYVPTSPPLTIALSIMPMMIFVSGAWAAGDVSLLAYVQSQLTESDKKAEVNVLGAVMGFMYASYVIISTFLTFGLGRVLDDFAARGEIQEGLLYVVIGISVLGVFTFLSTFIPKGSFRLNPPGAQNQYVEIQEHIEGSFH